MKSKKKRSNRSWKKHEQERAYGFWITAAHNHKSK